LVLSGNAPVAIRRQKKAFYGRFAALHICLQALPHLSCWYTSVFSSWHRVCPICRHGRC